MRPFLFLASCVGALVLGSDRPVPVPGVASAPQAAGARSPAPAPVTPPPAVPPLPSARHLAWHAREFYGFIHFGLNTFTDREWGTGAEDPAQFAPSALDPRQWARVARDAGMSGLILTAKHHDGFCLWPSRYTDHSVARSPWKGGRGDVVGELARACRDEGLAFGIYLSPWDRHHAEYGRPAYLTYYRNQLRELLTGYGPLFEVWFDGANGGEGYYGGAHETRRIDNATYYDWPATWDIVRTLQPGAAIFSDAGPDVRWVGNEKGTAFDDVWYGLDRAGLYPGRPDYASAFASGRIDAGEWVPPEVDVSIRPGWFHHPAEDGAVKSVEALVEIYEQSVGRGANLLLNIPPDRRGLIPEADAERLRAFRRRRDAMFRTDLAREGRAAASEVRGGSPRFAASAVLDADPETYWAAADETRTGWVEVALPQTATFDRVVLQEPIALGQRVQAWTLEAHTDGAWRHLAQGGSIGRKRIVAVEPTTADRVRVTVTRARACPAISTVAVYDTRGEG
jgi:alpha-L-fucosidase